MFIMGYALQLKERCRKGIPPAMRGVAWQHLCGADKLKQENPGVFGVSCKVEHRGLGKSRVKACLVFKCLFGTSVRILQIKTFIFNSSFDANKMQCPAYFSWLMAFML